MTKTIEEMWREINEQGWWVDVNYVSHGERFDQWHVYLQNELSWAHHPHGEFSALRPTLHEVMTAAWEFASTHRVPNVKMA